MCTETLDVVSEDLLNEIGAYGPECSDAMFAPQVQSEHLQLIANHTVLAAQELLIQAQAQIQAQKENSDYYSSGLDEGFVEVTYLSIICTFTMMAWLCIISTIRHCCPEDFEHGDELEEDENQLDGRESENMGAYRTTTELTFVGNKNLPPNEDNRRIEDAVDEQQETENE